MFVTGFVWGMIFCFIFEALLRTLAPKGDVRLLRKILAHLDPEDPDGEA